MPTGPRPPARPGAGPGRNKARARPVPRTSAAGSPELPPVPVAPTAAQSPRRRPSLAGATALGSRVRGTLTTRAIALVVVMLVLVISYASSLRIYFSQAHEIAATRTEIAERQQRIAELQTEVGRWNDADYVRTQARQRLGWVVPGEIGYQVIGPDGKPLGGGAEIDASSAAADGPQDAWWAKLWGSAEAADKPAPAKKKEKTISVQTDPSEGPR